VAGLGVGALYGSIAGAWSEPPISDTKGFNIARAAEFPKASAMVGRNAAIFSAVALAFSSADCLSESLRGTKDPINGMVGGMAAGALMGLQTKRFDVMCGAALGCGILSLIAGINGPHFAQQFGRFPKPENRM
jgi:hypothetical protein